MDGLDPNNKRKFPALYGVSFPTLLLDFLLVISALIGTSYNLHWSILHSSVLGGWDGVSHTALAQDYAQNIWPAIFGWTPRWYLGMPFPNFYHPLFFWIVGLFVNVTGLSSAIVVKWFVLLMTTAFPFLFYLLSAKHFGGRIAGLAAGFLSVFCMTRSDILAMNGLTLLGTYWTGLYAHLLGFELTLVWLLFFPSLRESSKNFWISTFLLFLVLFSNVNILINVLIIFVCIYLFDLGSRKLSWKSFREITLPYLSTGLIALAVTAVWYLPMFATFKWAPTQTLVSPGILAVPFNYYQMVLLFLAAVAAAYIRRNSFGLALSLSVLVSIIVASSSQIGIFAGLPIQPYRNLINALFFMIPVITIFLTEIALLSNRSWMQMAVVLFLPAALYFQDPTNLTLKYFGTMYHKNEFESLFVPSMNHSEGRFFVEFLGNRGNDSRRGDESWYLNGLAGNRGGYGLYSVYREASISSFFTDALRNAYSNHAELFATTSQIAQDPSFLEQSFEEQKKRSALFNLKYFFVDKKETKQKFEKEGYRHLASNWTWDLFEDPEDRSKYGHIPSRIPFLAFAQWKAKNRDYFGGYDYLSLAEAFFHANRHDLPFVLSPEQTLDSKMDWSPFSGLIITQFDYDNREEARKGILEFSRTKPVLILEGSDPLIGELKAYKNDRKLFFFTPFEYEPEVLGYIVKQIREAKDKESSKRFQEELEEKKQEIRESYRSPIRKMMAVMEQHALPVTQQIHVVRTEMSRNKVTVTLSEKPKTPVPLIIHQTYFPRWFLGEQGVALVYPTYQFVLAKEKTIHVSYRMTWIEKGARILSWGTLFLISLALIRRRRKRT